MRIGLVQFTAGDDITANLAEIVTHVRVAAQAGAELVLTPECTNLLSLSRAHQRATVLPEAEDPVLQALQAEAEALGIWILLGSIGVQTGEADGRFANRSILIGADGAIKARYDKIHMFDVNVSETEVYRESAAYRPGDRAVVAETPFGKIGMAICYDLRFPHLFRSLAKAGAQILTLPAAFNHITGAAHWEVLIRARAIESGCFVLAPAQVGLHPEAHGPGGRRTYGHSLVVAPWGEVLLDAGTEVGVSVIDIDLSEVEKARARVPSIQHDRDFTQP